MSMLSSIILIIGMMELRGVRSSWATEEKKMERIFEDWTSSSLILVMSEQMAMT